MSKTISLICSTCNKSFERKLKYHNTTIKLGLTKHYCSVICANKDSNLYRSNRGKTYTNIICSNCNIEYKIETTNFNQKIKNNNKNFYCSINCRNNHHIKRSKLEIYIETRLTTLYPYLDIKYNNKIIGKDLDIYIPDLNIAIEINGIRHFKPINGEKHLKYIQDNDLLKLKLCNENNINLYIIDSSKHIRITDKNTNNYLQMVIDIIENSLDIHHH